MKYAKLAELAVGAPHVDATPRLGFGNDMLLKILSHTFWKFISKVHFQHLGIKTYFLVEFYISALCVLSIRLGLVGIYFGT